jgi:hypothetical protein
MGEESYKSDMERMLIIKEAQKNRTKATQNIFILNGKTLFTTEKEYCVEEILQYEGINYKIISKKYRGYDGNRYVIEYKLTKEMTK